MTEAAATPPPPPTETTSEERSWAIWAHVTPVLMIFVTGGTMSFLAPLIIWLTKKDESEFIADQAKESLNFQITLWLFLLVYSAISGLLICAAGIGILLLFLTPALLVVPTLVFGILGTLAVNRGERYHYPFSLRLVG